MVRNSKRRVASNLRSIGNRIPHDGRTCQRPSRRCVGTRQAEWRGRRPSRTRRAYPRTWSSRASGSGPATTIPGDQFGRPPCVRLYQILTISAIASSLRRGYCMNVSLTPELERLVNEKVESGLYQTASEVVREALRLLKERDHAREQLRADVQAGFDQLARGEGRAYDRTSGRQLAERIKSRGRAARAKKS